MNSIDASDRHTKTDEVTPPPDLLAIILDTNPHAWAHLSSTLSLSTALANILVFINAHLASGHANEVAVIASHSNKTAFLYPTPSPPRSQYGSANGDVEMNGVGDEDTLSVEGNPNKYRSFAVIENAILRNFAKLLDETEEGHISATPATLIGGALSMALTHINKQTILHAPTTASAEALSLAALADAESSHVDRVPLTSRILIISVSGDLANQYIPVMNSVFAAHRKKIPIDILKLAGDTVLLQQASHTTSGVYMKPERPEGLLQYLMMAYLPDKAARESLVLPSAGDVDFRAACFCHRKVVDIGFVCSVCLSIFCSPNLPDNLCLTCQSYLSLRSATTNPPALIPRKKKKKKKLGTDSATPGAGTPTGSGTPMR